VYKVQHKTNHQFYALKKVKIAGLSEKEKENALNEVRILASLKHPYVVSYKESFIDPESESLW
jgi:NIMA (never in mitosis gene a)-related kinase